MDTADDQDAATGWAPEGPIEVSVGTNPGGTPDVVTRQAVECIAQEGIIDNPMVVQNREGGSWTVHTEYMLSAEGQENVIGSLVQPILTTPISQGLDPWHTEVTPLASIIQKDVVAR